MQCSYILDTAIAQKPWSTQLCTTNSKPLFIQPVKPCYNPKLAPSPAEPSPPYPTLRSLSVFFSFRILVLRRLRGRAPATARSCRCRRLLDPSGGHHAACTQSCEVQQQSAKKGWPESPPIPGSQTSTPSACPGSTTVP